MKGIRGIIIVMFILLGVIYADAGKRALLVGIGNYDKAATGWSRIHGNNDVALLTPLLEKHGFKVTSLTDSRATKKAIVGALRKLARECNPGDKVYFHFSGHGQRVTDCNGDEGRSGLDEAAVPYDACRSAGYGKGGYNGEKHLVDDEYTPLLEAVRKKIGKTGELFVVFDACYSRGLERGMDDGEEFPEDFDVDDLPEFVRGTADRLEPADRRYLTGIPLPEKFGKGCRMTVVSACRENERNFEYRAEDGKNYGSLSYCISLLLRKNADFSVWTRYFQCNGYKTSGCFVRIQQPTITVYQ